MATPSRVDSAFRVVAVCAVLVLGFYLGRPIYWAVEDRVREAVLPSPADANASTALAPSSADDAIPADLTTDPAGLAATDPPSTASDTPADDAVNADASVVAARAERAEEAAAAGSDAAAGPAAADGEAKETKASTEEAAGGEAGADSADVKGFAKGVRPILHEGRPLLELLKQPIWTKPAEDTPLPAREEFALRREMVDFRKKDNVVVVTFANFAFMDFVTNWVRHLTNLGVFNILVGAMDQKILEGLFYEGVPVFDLESGMPEMDAGWGTPLFHKMGREKVTLVNVFLSLGVELFITDTDVVFLRDPVAYMARFPEADVLTSSDNLVRSVDDESLEHWDRAQAAYNIGILHFRPTDPAKRFAREWAELLDGDDKIWDQNGFNDIMRKQIGPEVEGLNNHLFWAYDGKLKCGIMPVSIFCSGHTYFVQRLYKTVGLQPYAMHATFQYAGTEGKRHRFREAKEFYDPPEYYNPDNGVISFVNKIPEDLLTGGAHSLETHFNLVNYELKNLRQALAVASILNRTLVMPEMWCRFDRIWYPHSGILDGTDTPQPFLCPLDHIIEVQKMLPTHVMNPAEFGYPVPFREYSFLENPRTPDVVFAKKAVVQLCDADDAACEEGKVEDRPDGGKTIYLKKQPSQNTILKLLQPLSEHKLLEFSQIQDSFGAWDVQVDGEKFNRRIRQYTGIWCCVNAQPGHIWYDFFASEKPDWKPMPPKSWQDDHPAWDRRRLRLRLR